MMVGSDWECNNCRQFGELYIAALLQKTRQESMELYEMRVEPEDVSIVRYFIQTTRKLCYWPSYNEGTFTGFYALRAIHDGVPLRTEVDDWWTSQDETNVH